MAHRFDNPRRQEIELRRLARELQELRTYTQVLVENVSDVLAILAPDGVVRYVSPSVHRVLGYHPDEQLGRLAIEFVHPEDVGRLRRFMVDGIRSGRTNGRVAYRYLHKNGSWRHLESAGVNLIANPHVSGILVTSRDVTERLEMEGRYRTLFDNMVEGFAHCQVLYEDGQPRDWVYLEVNAAFEPLTGLRNVTGKRVSEVAPGLLDTSPELLRTYARIAATRSNEKFETFVPALDRWFAVSAYGTGPAHFVAIFENITERKRTEERLTRSEAEYRSLIEHAPLGIFRSAPDGQLLAVNPALVAMLGHDSTAALLKVNLQRDVYVDPRDRERVTAASAERNAEVTVEVPWKRKDGHRIEARIHVRPVKGAGGAIEHFEALVEDVTEQRSLERQFQQAQKMEAIGRLAGGVAHDFNNLLTAITGYGELLLDELGSNDERRDEVQEILNAAHRAGGLTRQLLAFSRKQVFQPRALDLNEEFVSLQKMLERLIGEDIGLKVVLSEEPAVVHADPNQIEQIVLNLVVNARDAMPDGGSLTLEIANLEVDDLYVRDHAGLTTGLYVMFAVSDTGTGIAPDVLPHIFEPFFTTKGQGKGTGLGLATVYGMVKQCGGSIAVYSEVGGGSTFKIYLPRVDQPLEGIAKAAAAQEVPGGSETLLLVEDDASVRNVAFRILSQKGYRLLCSNDGPAALDVARAHAGTIDLLLTDLVMPRMSGRELAAAFHSEQPAARVLFMSGYADDAAFRHGVLTAGMHYLQKPFTAAGLARKVREVLDSGR